MKLFTSTVDREIFSAKFPGKYHFCKNLSLAHR